MLIINDDVVVLPAFGSCTCSATLSPGSYDCTCDETDDCAISHVIGGKSISSKCVAI